MTVNRTTSRRNFRRGSPAILAVSGLALPGLVFGASAARAQTIAYYRFESGAPGAPVPVTPDSNPASLNPVLDSSGNGNNMKSFASFSTPSYAANVPAIVIPNTGATNVSSLSFSPNRDVYSQNAVGGGAFGTTLNDHQFSAFTIEASVNFSSLAGFQTFVGRDRPGSTLGFFYLRKWSGGGALNNSINATLVADNGTAFDLFSAGTGAGNSFSQVSANTWYNVVAQSDGSQFRLYVQNNATRNYELQASVAVNTGLSSTGATNFTLGRGWFNSPADFLNGFVDEVRISDTALAPSQFLFARSAAVVPEPGEWTLIATASLFTTGLLWRARRRASASSHP